MKVKEESKKADLKLSIQKNKIMASSPITSWQIVGETMENTDRLYFLGLQNHHSDCILEIKRHCSLEDKLWQTCDSVLKSRDITLLTKVCIVKLWFSK